MHLYDIYEEHSIGFQIFVEQAFKIGVDSWEFSMLLLYILWDDWLIFMISGSNEQLQQELEYILLKPDCHCWWISKMQSRREDTLEERYAIKFCFKLGKNATETYGMLQTAFGESCINRKSFFELHKRFKEGRESVRDDERCARSKEVNRPELIGQRVRFGVKIIKDYYPFPKSSRAGHLASDCLMSSRTLEWGLTYLQWRSHFILPPQPEEW